MICELEKEAAELYNKAKGTNNEIDWLKIGAEFQENLEQGKRRELGVHYTSEENILKLIKPLFLDDLKAEFGLAKSDKQKILVFLDKLAKLKFLDPACGCGNFLIIAFRELKLLEFEALTALSEYLEINNTYFRVSPDQFYGIEIEEEPCHVTELCLYLVGLQMYHEGIKRFNLNHSKMYFEPPKTIIHANALRIDWNDVIPKEQLDYIMGNPPFAGYVYQNYEQKEDMKLVFGNKIRLDYVAAWYKKASDYMLNTKIDSAFVSTNSISQGEQPAILWKPLMKENNTEINFAHRAFKWSNESTSKKATVHCVIIGFSDYKNNKEKKIYGSENNYKLVDKISPYLNDNCIEAIARRRSPICENIPKINKGIDPADGGNYIFLENEMNAFIEKEPSSKKYFRRWIGADDMINGYKRYVLYLKDCPPFELKKMKETLKLVDRVRLYRASSPRVAVRKKSLSPTLLAEDRIPSSKFLVIPTVSSGKRKYIPIEYKSPPDVCWLCTLFIENATLYHFGVLTSSVHMAWTRAVCGRLGNGYRYSKDIVYNNFIWPNPTAKQKEQIEKLAQGVLDARKLYPECTLAYLYDPNTMPPELLEAHNKLDNAVKEAYGTKGFETEEEIIASLMKLYKKAIDEREASL